MDGLQRQRFRDINDNGLITGFVGNQMFVGTPGDWYVFAARGDGATMFGYGLNNAGALVGSYFDDVTQTAHGLYSAPIPEPAPWMLLALGMAGAAVRLRLRGA